MDFGHADETRVGKVHGHIVIFVQQSPDSPRFGLKIKHDADDLAVVQLSQCPA